MNKRELKIILEIKAKIDGDLFKRMDETRRRGDAKTREDTSVNLDIYFVYT